jgi:RNA polymerase sigma-70 factor (sigma-E family)
MDARLADYVRGQWPALVRYATMLSGDPAEAEELVQQTLTRVAIRWRFIEGKDNPDGYVRRALVRACIDSGKRRRREPTMARLPELAVSDRASEVADADRVRRALATLPLRQRAVLVLRYFDDASEARTAEILGCSVGTVKSQAAKALAKLRELVVLDDVGQETP